MSKRIFTMQDIMDTVTEENIKRFIPDLIKYVNMLVLLKNMKAIKTEGFDWIDDGLNNSEVTIDYTDAAVRITKDGFEVNKKVSINNEATNE